MKTRFIVLVLLLVIAISLISPAFAESKTKIPEWIKQIAEFWITDQIDDTGFVQVIQYLIQNEIIVVLYTEAPESSETAEIPVWIKTNAEFWVNEQISDDEFAIGLEWLINHGIIIVKTMNLTSDAFEKEGLIPSEYTCDGNDVSPHLSISGVPNNAKSLALIMDDPDAPVGTFVHWVVWNISPDKSIISKGENLSEPQGRTDFGKSGYGGPCPPSGTHRYFFKIYALDTMLEIDIDSTKKDLETAMQDHIIEQATLMGKYSRN